MADYAIAQFWAQVVPVWSRWWPLTMTGVKVLRITQRKPREPEPGCILLKLRLSVPVAAFVPPEFEVSPVQIEAGDYEQVPPRLEPVPGA